MIALNEFEEKYILVREKEDRLYTDEQVKWLPGIERSHPHYQEWKARENSSNKLITYLANKKKKLKILEVGCGNGWLCYRLSKIQGCHIVGIDINRTELNQAKRVFNGIRNIDFFYGNITDERIRREKFDVIIFAASIQYFSSPDKAILPALQLLNPSSEIHILDSHFYRSAELDLAKKRSAEYYRSIHFSEMSSHYFHHCINELEHFNYKILYNPNSFLNRFVKNKNPFPWICIYA
jgi:ubiquinone/menaquinone biosynthesis C-methylase UbiE